MLLNNNMSDHFIRNIIIQELQDPSSSIYRLVVKIIEKKLSHDPLDILYQTIQSDTQSEILELEREILRVKSLDK